MAKIFKEEVRRPEFERDLKHLAKKFPSLPDDLETLVSTSLNLYHKLEIKHDGIKRIENLGVDRPQIFKVLKFACRALKGRGAKSGLRLIYAYYPDLDKIEFVEVYFKADRVNENRARILGLYKS
jgi:mRNA-degrading endonuclease RelE of RelBE toxin-antitoxin system